MDLNDIKGIFVKVNYGLSFHNGHDVNGKKAVIPKHVFWVYEKLFSVKQTLLY